MKGFSHKNHLSHNLYPYFVLPQNSTRYLFSLQPDNFLPPVIMKSVITLLSIFLIIPYLASAGDLSYFWSRFKCGDPETYAETYNVPLTCIENSIPPWPICLFHNTTYFIQAALSSASRCCDSEDLEECRCPVKYHPKFALEMVPWCAAIATCPNNTALKPDLVSDAWNIIVQKTGGYDWQNEDWENGNWSYWGKQSMSVPTTSENSRTP